MEHNKKIPFSHQEVADVKKRMRELSDMNQELRMKNNELKKHLDTALKSLFKNTVESLEKRNNVRLKIITYDNARTILFTDEFKQLAYLKDEELMFVSDDNRQWVYDNAQKFKWFIAGKKQTKDDQGELELTIDADAPKKSFHDTLHEVRIQDLPAYLKIYRYEEQLKTSDIDGINQSQWANYERGTVEPSKKMIDRLEKIANIKVIYTSGVKTIHINNFGERLAKVIEERGLTFSKVAKKIVAPQATINNYVYKDNHPLAHLPTMKNLANVLDESICYLTTGTREWE